MQDRCAYLSGILGLRDLRILPSILLHCTNDLCERICADIKRETSIDLLDIQQVSNLSDANANKLKEYEVEHADDLIALVVRTNTNKELSKKGLLHPTTETKYTVSSDYISWAIFWYGVSLSIATIIIIAVMIFFPIPENNQRFADTALGWLFGSILSPIVTYYFGSSMKKTDYHSMTQKQKLFKPPSAIDEQNPTEDMPDKDKIPRYRPGSSNPKYHQDIDLDHIKK